MITIFDGYQFAQEREALLQQHVAELGQKIKIAAILFTEDKPAFGRAMSSRGIHSGSALQGR